MKRSVLVLAGLLAILLAACVPSSQVARNVVPQLISASPPNAAGDVVLQGRYFGGGGEGSYVLLGANVDAEGGVRVLVPEAWRRAPDLTLWWVGDDPADPWGVLAFADLPSFDAERDLGAAVVARLPDAVGGTPATR